MGEAPPEVTPLGLSILELLNERPMHPYELAATMRDRHCDEFVRLNFGSLYHTVESLERSGWIVPSEREREGGRPERTIYRLTDPGREVLLRAVSTILGEPRREYLHFSAGLMYMHNLGREVAVQRLEQRAQKLHGVITKLSLLLDDLLATGHTRLILIELEHKIAVLEAEHDWVRKIVKEITDGKLEWKVGIEADPEKLRRRHGTGAH